MGTAADIAEGWLDRAFMALADPVRRATALRFLWDLSATNQVVISTSDPTLVTALRSVCDGEAPAVVAMAGAAVTVETTGRAVATARRL